MINDNMISIKETLGDKMYTTFCDLRTLTPVDNVVVESDKILCQWDECYAYIDNSLKTPTVTLTSMSIDGSLYQPINLKTPCRNVKATIIENDKKIRIEYEDRKGRHKTLTKKIDKYINPPRKAIENFTTPKCQWSNKLIKKTKDYYLYNVSLEINRQDPINLTKQYQLFYKNKGKVIGGICSKGETLPSVKKVQDNLYKISYQYDFYNEYNKLKSCKYYNTDGTLSPEFTNVICERNNKVVYEKEQYGYRLLAIADMFHGNDIVQQVSENLYDIDEIIDGSIDKQFSKVTIKYINLDEQKQTLKISLDENLNIVNAPGNRVVVKNDNVAQVWDRGYERNIPAGYDFEYMIYDSNGKVMYHGETLHSQPEIKRITDNITMVTTFHGTNAFYSTFFNTVTREKTKAISSVSKQKGNMIVYPDFDFVNNEYYVCVKYLFEDKKEIRHKIKDWWLPGTETVTIKNNQIKVKYYSDKIEDDIVEIVNIE